MFSKMLKLIIVTLILSCLLTKSTEAYKVITYQKLIVTPPPDLVQQLTQAVVEKKTAIKGLLGQALQAKANFHKSLGAVVQTKLAALPTQITLQKTPFYTKTITFHGIPAAPASSVAPSPPAPSAPYTTVQTVPVTVPIASKYIYYG